MTTANKSIDQRQEQTASVSFPDAAHIVDVAAMGLCVIETNGCISHANAAFAAALSMAPGAVLGEKILRFIHSDDADVFCSAMTDLHVHGSRPVVCEMRVLQPDGGAIWFKAGLSSFSDGSSKKIVLQIQSIDELWRSRETLKNHEMRWKYALESAHQGVWDHDFRSGELFYSAHWKAIRGLAADAAVDGSLDVWIESVHPADREHVLEYIRRQDQGEVEFNTFAYRERHADGHWVWIESRGACVEWDPDGQPSRIIGTDTDITERKMAEEHLEEISRRLRLALDVSKIGVFEANLDVGTVDFDEQLLRIYGLDPTMARDPSAVFDEILHPQDRDSALLTIGRGIESGLPFVNAFRIVRPDGEIRHIRSRSVTFTDAAGHRKLVGANWDITEDVALRDELDRARQLAEARNLELEAARTRIEYNALHDHLTGLPNRRFLDKRFEDWIAESVTYCAVLHIDLDRFKQINDTLGHQAGDAMLVHTARVLQSFVEEGDFVARIGGDEFVILCSDRHTQDMVVLMTDRIIDTLRQPVPYHGILCRFGASVGIAWARDGAADAKQSLMDADIALYKAKGLGRNRYEFFTKELQTQILHTKRTADEIVKGLEDGEFLPVYQPQFDARTLEVAGVEALARWAHPRQGLLSPDYFLKIAEDINVLPAIDQCIAEQALKDFKSWEKHGFAIPRISVNVSSPRLREPGLIESLKQLGIPRGKLSFELLESIFLDDLDECASQTLSDLKALGIDIEIDDFGTGHASIIGLMKLSPSRLKIDRALVMPITETPEQRKLVGSIIDIGHSLNIEVVAEGVETREHADILRDLGCDTLQGYAFAKPMTKAELEQFLQSGRWRPVCMPVQRLHDRIRQDFKA